MTQYRLEAELGRGTYGVVYRGVHVAMPELKRAVKVLHPALLGDPDFQAAIQNEVRLLVQLDHPGIVKLHDLVVEPTRLALLLELLEGDDLLTRVGRGARPVDEVADALLQMLDALAFAHDRGVVHCDVKPANVFRCHDGRVKLMDFGVSKAAGKSRATRTGQISGTLDYMAPEVFEGRVTPAADVYAAGLVAWELLAGRAACEADSLPQKMHWHTSRGPSDLLAVRNDTPAWLREAIRALSARDLAERPATGAEAAALVRSLQPRPPRGPVTTPPQTVTIGGRGERASPGGRGGATSHEGGITFGPVRDVVATKRREGGGEALRVLAVAGLFAAIGIGGTLLVGLLAALLIPGPEPEPEYELNTDWLDEIPEEPAEPAPVAPPPQPPSRLSELLAAPPAVEAPQDPPPTDFSGEEWAWLRELELTPPADPPKPTLLKLEELVPPPQELTETWLRLGLWGRAAELSACGATLAPRDASNLEVKVERDGLGAVRTTPTRGELVAGFCVGDVIKQLGYPVGMKGTASVTFTKG